MALLLGSVWSFFRGLIREVLSIVGLTAAFVLSLRNYPYVAQHLETVIAHPWLRQAAGFALIFLPIVVLYVGIAVLLHRLIKVAGLALPNRLLGGVFGLVKVTVVLAAFCLVSQQLFPPFAAKLAGESLLAPMFFRVADALSVLLPPSAATQLQEVSERLRPPSRGKAPAARPPTSPQSPAPPASAAPRQEGIAESDARALEKLLRQRLDTQ
jgi:membrane protein required for colicin V production